MTIIIIRIIIIRRTHWSRACQMIGIFLLNYLGSILSLLRSLRGPRRRQILLGSKGGRSWVDAGSMSAGASGRLIITREAQWMVTLELLEATLRLSWSPLGVPDTSRASKYHAQISFGEVFLRF